MTSLSLPINLNYYFGSGGFYALWILILGTKLEVVFRNTLTLQETFDTHWNIKSIKDWKRSEEWIDNSRSEITHICNPNQEEWDRQKGTRIVVYTDIDTQYKLAKAKSAGPWSGPVMSGINNYSMDEYKSVTQAKYKNMYVYHLLPEKLKQADFTCNLKDIIDTNGNALLQYFDCSANEKCIEFTKQYIKLHKGLLDES